ncbi:MAG: hypothetical protein ACKOBW_14265 [Planctomycetota bacterium]
MSRFVKWMGMACSGLLATGALLAPGEAWARPQYSKNFIAHYTEVKAAAEAKCGICHPGMDKKEKNNYGMAFGKGLSEKNLKDDEKIKEALKKAEAEKSAVEGKTFGDLLKDGKLPASK